MSMVVSCNFSVPDDQYFGLTLENFHASGVVSWYAKWSIKKDYGSLKSVGEPNVSPRSAVKE
jgi:hypothetical protein